MNGSEVRALSVALMCNYRVGGPWLFFVQQASLLVDPKPQKIL